MNTWAVDSHALEVRRMFRIGSEVSFAPPQNSTDLASSSGKDFGRTLSRDPRSLLGAVEQSRHRPGVFDADRMFLRDPAWLSRSPATISPTYLVVTRACAYQVPVVFWGGSHVDSVTNGGDPTSIRRIKAQ